MIDRVKQLWAREPARVVAVLVAVIVFAASKAGVVLDERSVADALVLILPVLVGGEVTRASVSPAKRPLSELPTVDEVQVRP